MVPAEMEQAVPSWESMVHDVPASAGRGFFLQAEYGIRGPLVTGVQTCALPFSADMVEVSALLDRAIWVPSTVTESEASAVPSLRSEERRVGKEGGSAWVNLLVGEERWAV